MMELKVEKDVLREESAGQITAQERRWLAIFAILVLVIVSMPYLIGFSTQTSDWRFTGFVLGVEDGNSYIAKMLLGGEGAWVFRTPYTTFPQKGVIAFLPYFLLGKLTAGAGRHEQLVALFHLFRILSGWLLIRASYDLVAYFIKNVSMRRLAAALITLGGGLGWLLVFFGRENFLGSLPLEFYSPESFGFLSLYAVPHLALGRAFMLWGLLIYLKNGSRSGIGWEGIARLGVLWLAAAIAQPLYAVIFGYILAAHLTIRGVWNLANRRVDRISWQGWFTHFRLAAGAALIPGPFILYNLIVFSTDPFLKAWTAQNIILSPHPFHYALAYGLVLVFTLGGMLQSWREPTDGTLLLTAWSVSLPLLAYLPFNLQRRLPEGIWVALVILALIYLEDKQNIHKSLAWRMPQSFFFLSFPSTLILLAGGIFAVLRPSLPLFRPAAEVAAFQFLDNHSEPEDVVLASFETGNALPAWADVRVVVGHGPESVSLSSLQPKVNAFYRSNTKRQERINLIRDQGVAFIFLGPLERTQPDWDLASMDFARSIYHQDGYEIYRVDQTQP